MINLIGISGRIGSGKDTVTSMTQYLTEVHPYLTQLTFENYRTHSPCSPWQNRKFAAKLKQIASLLTGIPIEKFEDQEFKKTELGKEWTVQRGPNMLKGPVGKDAHYDHFESPLTVREFLQKLGTEAIRNNIHPNAWVNALFADYKPANMQLNKTYSQPDLPKWIISDCRFPNEAQAIKDRGGVVVRIDRKDPSQDYITLEQHQGLHPSETALDNWAFDYIIDNTHEDLNQLLMKVELMLHHFQILKPQSNGTDKSAETSVGNNSIGSGEPDGTHRY